MTFQEAIETNQAFKRPHWKAEMKMDLGGTLVWVSSGDPVDSLSVPTALAEDFIIIPKKFEMEIRTSVTSERLEFHSALRKLARENPGKKIKVRCELT